MSARFYLNCALQPGPVTLEGAEAHHLTAVCRLRPGNAVCLFNGDGHEYAARVVAVQRRSVDLEIESIASPPRELPFTLEVAAPLPKGDRAQFLIEKLTELGATTFVPLDCERSVIHPREAKLEKLQRHVIEASKQCGRNVLMRVLEPSPWTTYCLPRPQAEVRWLADPQGSNSSAPPQLPIDIRVAVGPEGGFTTDEVAAGRQNGWELIGLGPRMLRIETAALAMAWRACLAR